MSGCSLETVVPHLLDPSVGQLTPGTGLPQSERVRMKGAAQDGNHNLLASLGSDIPSLLPYSNFSTTVPRSSPHSTGRGLHMVVNTRSYPKGCALKLLSLTPDPLTLPVNPQCLPSVVACVHCLWASLV